MSALARWLFDSGDPRTIARFRIAVAGMMLAARLASAPDALLLYGDRGLVPPEVLEWHQLDLHLSLFHLAGSDAAVIALYAAMLLALAALAAGFHTRTAAIASFLLQLSLEHRNPLIANANEQMFTIVTFWLCFADSGAALSLDARRGPARRWRGCLAWRALQIELCVCYGLAAAWKLADPDWRAGDMMFYVIAKADHWWVSLLPLLDFAWIHRTVTWGTIVFEAVYPLLVWWRPARAPLILTAVVFHLAISAGLGLPTFGLAMIGMQLLFVEPRRDGGREHERAPVAAAANAGATA